MANKGTPSSGARVTSRDGYTVKPGNPGVINNGYKPTTGQLGTPPSGGSAVSKPSKK